jgi:hypothetical protein
VARENAYRNEQTRINEFRQAAIREANRIGRDPSQIRVRIEMRNGEQVVIAYIPQSSSMPGRPAPAGAGMGPHRPSQVRPPAPQPDAATQQAHLRAAQAVRAAQAEMGRMRATVQGRDSMGRFTSKNGGEARPGAWFEETALDLLTQYAPPGSVVFRGQIWVRNPDTGQVRIFDGAIRYPGETGLRGVEAKSGGARRTGPQREFDGGLERGEFEGVGMGQVRGRLFTSVITVTEE